MPELSASLSTAVEKKKRTVFSLHYETAICDSRELLLNANYCNRQLQLSTSLLACYLLFCLGLRVYFVCARLSLRRCIFICRIVCCRAVLYTPICRASLSVAVSLEDSEYFFFLTDFILSFRIYENEGVSSGPICYCGSHIFFVRFRCRRCTSFYLYFFKLFFAYSFVSERKRVQ